MLDTAIFRRLRAAARRFAGANDGNIAILFGIAVIPIISFVGAAVDYTRANSARSSMQAALDSTALMVAKDLTEGTINTSQITAKADAYFKALYTNTGSQVGHDHRELYAELRQRVDHPDQRLRQHGDRVSCGSPASRKWVSTPIPPRPGATSRMRVAMVLDVTGSMDDERQDGGDARRPPRAWSIRSGALAKNTGDIYISIVPFAKDVNVGTSDCQRDLDRLGEWDDSSPEPTTGGTLQPKLRATRHKSFLQERQQDLDSRNHDASWNGCVTDRDARTYDTKNTPPTSCERADDGSWPKNMLR